ncbi:MAG: 1-aminocyclopropane-1-carboxylate deaminase/D-cysteine desulfhydrase, partial [Pseudomonadota bacterium]
MVQSEIILQKIEEDLFHQKNVSVMLARLDLLHPDYGGNKWFKLKYNLAAAKKNNFKQVLTFGGAFSNHIYSTAAICADEGFASIGVIRGEETLPLNTTLQFALSKNMKLHYVSRVEFKNRSDIEFINKLKKIYGDFYLIPDGGSNALGIKGAMEILPILKTDFD